MDAAKTSELRRKCFKAGIKLVVVKNSLLHKALMSMEGVDFSPLFDSLKGTTSVMFSEVANAPAKLLKEYKEEIPALKAAYAEEGFYVSWRPRRCGSAYRHPRWTPWRRSRRK